MVLGGIYIDINGTTLDKASNTMLTDRLQAKDVHRLPDGYTWSEYNEKFVTPTDHAGVWIDGMESGMKYKVWDVVYKDNAIYADTSKMKRKLVAYINKYIHFTTYPQPLPKSQLGS